MLCVHVWLLATAWTVAHEAPLSMWFSRQEYWSGLPFPSPEDLPDPGMEPASPALTGSLYRAELHGKLIPGIYSYLFTVWWGLLHKGRLWRSCSFFFFFIVLSTNDVGHTWRDDKNLEYDVQSIPLTPKSIFVFKIFQNVY